MKKPGLGEKKVFIPSLWPKSEESVFYNRHKPQIIMSDRGRKIKEPISFKFDEDD